MQDPNKIFRILIKFMNAQYVDSFLNEGLLFMNNIDFFKNYEDPDLVIRGDAHEGLAASYKADDVTIRFGDYTFEGVVGKIDIRYDHEDDTNIYSMTKISDGIIIEAGETGLYLSEDFLKFGDTAVVIDGSNITEFENRLKQAIFADKSIFTLRDDNVFAKQVSYLNRDEHHSQMDVFKKFDKYSWQYEWRIAFKQVSRKGPYSLKIGRLSDIAHVFETESLLNYPIKLVPDNLYTAKE